MESNTKGRVNIYKDTAEMYFYHKSKSSSEEISGIQKKEYSLLPLYDRRLISNRELQTDRNEEPVFNEALVHPALGLHSNPKKILIIGGRSGATLKEVLKHRRIELIVMADLEEGLTRIFPEIIIKRHSPDYLEHKMRLILVDGKKYLENKEETFDVIISDKNSGIGERRVESFDPDLSMYSKDFYSICKSKLNPLGILVLQVMELTPGDWAVFLSRKCERLNLYTG